MSYPTQQMFRPIEADIDLSRLQFSDYPNQGLQVADYSNIEYLKQSDSEEEMDDDVMNYTHGDSGHANGSGGVSEEIPQSPASPTSPTEGSTPLSSKKTAKNKAKKAKQKAKAKEKKAAIAAVASGESAPSSRPETPMSPLSPTSPMSSFFSGEGGNDSEGTTSSKSKSKSKKKKAKKSGSSSEAASSPPEPAVESLDGKVEESVSVPEPQVEEAKPEELQVQQPQIEEPQIEESQIEEPQVEEPQVEEPQVEEPQTEEVKAEEPQVEEPQVEEPQVEEVKAEEPQVEEPQVEEPQVEEVKAEEPQVEEVKAEEPQVEEPQVEEVKAEEPQVEEPQVEEPQVEEPQVEEVKAEESIPVSESKVTELQVEEPQLEPQTEEVKAEESIPVSESQVEEAKTEEHQTEEPIPVTEPQVEEMKVDEPEVGEAQSKEPQVDEAKAEETQQQIEPIETTEVTTNEPILDSSVYSPPVMASEEPQSVVEEPTPAEKSDELLVSETKDISNPEPSSEAVESSESKEESSSDPEAPISESQVDSIPKTVAEEPQSVEAEPTPSDDAPAPEIQESNDPEPTSVIVESSEPVVDSKVEEPVSEEPRSVEEPTIDDELAVTPVSEVKETSSAEPSSEVVDAPETKESSDPEVSTDFVEAAETKANDPEPRSEIVEPVLAPVEPDVTAKELQTESEQPVTSESNAMEVPSGGTPVDDVATISAPADEDRSATALQPDTEIVNEEAALASGEGISSVSEVEEVPATSGPSEADTVEPQTELEVSEDKVEQPLEASAPEPAVEEPSAPQTQEEAVSEPEQVPSGSNEVANIEGDKQSDEPAPTSNVEASEVATEETSPPVAESQHSESQTIVDDAQPKIEEASEDAGPAAIEPQLSDSQQSEETAQPEAKENEVVPVAETDHTDTQSAVVENEPVSSQVDPEVIESQPEAPSTNEDPAPNSAEEPSMPVSDAAPAEEQVPEPTESKDESSTPVIEASSEVAQPESTSAAAPSEPEPEPVVEASSEVAQPESTSAPAPSEPEPEPVVEASSENTPVPISDSAPVESEVPDDTPTPVALEAVIPEENATETPQGDAQQSGADIASSEQVEEKATEPVVEEKTEDVTGKTTLATPFGDVPTVQGVGENHVASINPVCASLPKSEASSRSRGDDVEKQTDGEVAAPSSSIKIQGASPTEEQQSSGAVESRDIPAAPAEDEDVSITVISDSIAAVPDSDILDSMPNNDKSMAEKGQGASTVERELDTKAAVSTSREDDQLADSGVVLPEGDVTATSVSQEDQLADDPDDFVVVEKSDIPASSQVENLSSQEATAAPMDTVPEENSKDITTEETLLQGTPTEEVRADSGDSQQPAGDVPESSTLAKPEVESFETLDAPVEQIGVSNTTAPAEESINQESFNKEVEPQSTSENDRGGKLAAEVSAVAAGSLLVAPALMEATREGGKKSESSRDISEGIPTEPSAHDLPPYSPSPTPDAAQSVEPVKKSSSAGSQYGTFQVSDQQEAQQASPGEREVRVSDGAESSARSLKDVVVKDEVVKPSATSTTPDTLNLEPPSGPEAAGDSDDPVVVQPKGDHSLGSGEGDENRGEDHDVDDTAVMKDAADEKEIATHSENMGPADPLSSQVGSESGGIQKKDDDSVSPLREEEEQIEKSTMKEAKEEAKPPLPQPETARENQQNAAEFPPAGSSSPEEDLEAKSEKDGNSELPVVVTEEEENHHALAAETEVEDSIQNVSPVLDDWNLPVAMLPPIDDQVERPESSQTQDGPIQSPPDLETTSKDQDLSQPQPDAVRSEDSVHSGPEQQEDSDAAAPTNAESPPISHDQPIDLEDNSSRTPQEIPPIFEPSESRMVDEPEVPSVEELPNSTQGTDFHSGFLSEQPQSSSDAVSGNRNTDIPEAVESSACGDPVTPSSSEEAPPVLDRELEPVPDSQDVESADQGESEELTSSAPHDAQALSNPEDHIQATSDILEGPQETAAVNEAAPVVEDLPAKQTSSTEQQNALGEGVAPVSSSESEAQPQTDLGSVTDDVATLPAPGDSSETPEPNARDHPLPDQEDLATNSKQPPTETLDPETQSQPDPAQVEGLAITDIAPADSRKALDQGRDKQTFSTQDQQGLLPETQAKEDYGTSTAPELDTISNQHDMDKSLESGAHQASDEVTPVVEAAPPQNDDGQSGLTASEDSQVPSGQEESMPDQSIQEKPIEEPYVEGGLVDESDEITAVNGEEKNRDAGQLDPASPKQFEMSQEDSDSPPFIDVVDKELWTSEAVLEETPAPESTVDDLDDSGVNLEPGEFSLLDDSLSKDIDSHAMDALQTADSEVSEEDLQETSQPPEIVKQPAPHSEQPILTDEGLQKDMETRSTRSIGQEGVEDGDQELEPVLVDEKSISDSVAPREGPSDEPEAPSQAEQEAVMPSDEIVDQNESSETQPIAAPSEAASDGEDEDGLKDATLATGAAAVAAVAAVAAHDMFSGQDQEEKPSPQPENLEPERPRTADKASGSDDAPPADLEMITPKEPLHELAIVVDHPAAVEQDQEAGLDEDFKPRPSRRDSSTQTDELWRPKTPLPRGSTLAVVLPDPDDPQARDLSQARVSRRLSRRSAHQAEEVVAAAVIIRAAADTLGDTSSRMADAVKDLKQPGDANAPSNSRHGRRSTGDANSTLRGSSANRATGVDRTSKSDEKAPHPPRTREHRSSHGSRSSRPSTRDSAAKPHRHSSHRHRHEGDREAEQDSPQTPPKTAESGHSSHRSRRERTPQEQAEHDKRKEERRLAREKEREKLKTDSPAAEAKGKAVEASPSTDRSHRSSRRYSSTRKDVASPAASASRTEGPAPPPASRKFFDLKNGQSVVDGTFGGPLTADDKSTRSKDVSLKRTSTVTSSKGVQRSLSQTNAKLQKARVEESVKATKDKEDKERSRDNKTSNGHKSKDEVRSKERDDKRRQSRLEKREEAASGQKEEKKKSGGGLKGMFKKLFS